MRHLRLLTLPIVGIGLLVGAAQAGAADESAAVPPTTIVDGSAPTTTALGDALPGTTLTPIPAPPRAGSAIGDLDKREADVLWSTRQMATAIAVAVGVLAVIGYAYGRVRSLGT